MTEITPTTIIERYRRAKEQRSVWESHWQECYDYALPQRDGIVRRTQAGEKKTDKLFDGTAPDAVDQLAASLLAQLTPPWARWFGFVAGPDATDEERDALSAELDRAASALQSHFDRSNFAVEMLLEPVDIADGRLDPERLRPYEDDLRYTEANGEATLILGDKRLMSASCWWDPSFGAPDKGDASVIAALYTDADGDYWLHAVEYLEHDPDKAQAVDEATQLCRRVARFVRANHLPAVTLETNGLGRFLPGLLRRELARAGLRCAVIEKASARSKDLRILDAFDAVLAAGRLHAHRRVLATPFIAEMREWRPGARARDDGLDAVSGCLLSEPVRLSRLPDPPARRVRAEADWRPGRENFRAKSEFDI